MKREPSSNSFRILKDYTNRHMDSSLKEVMIRIQMEAQVNSIFHNCEDREKEVTDLFLNTHVCRSLK